MKIKFLKRAEKELEQINSVIYRESIWKRIVEGADWGNDECGENVDKCYCDKLEFIQNCMDENLAHARHIENERLTFNSFFVGLTAGALALFPQVDDNKVMAILICIVMTFGAYINLSLTDRWNFCFNRHMFYAKNCYKTLHIKLFGKGNNDNLLEYRESLDIKMSEENFNINEYPAYCFNIIRNIRGELWLKKGTNFLFSIFNHMLMIIWVGVLVVFFFC